MTGDLTNMGTLDQLYMRLIKLLSKSPRDALVRPLDSSRAL